jgi:hypothetical protein
MSPSLRGDMSQVDTSRVDAEASASATPSGASPWKRRQVGAAGWQRWGGLRCCTTVLVGSRLSTPTRHSRRSASREPLIKSSHPTLPPALFSAELNFQIVDDALHTGNFPGDALCNSKIPFVENNPMQRDDPILNRDGDMFVVKKGSDRMAASSCSFTSVSGTLTGGLSLVTTIVLRGAWSGAPTSAAHTRIVKHANPASTATPSRRNRLNERSAACARESDVIKLTSNHFAE